MNRLIATRLSASLDGQGLPGAAAWESAALVGFCADWRGENPDPERETCVQALWSPDHFFLRYFCRFREIFVYEGGPCRRDALWQRDVAEVFVQPPGEEPQRYREFEISPNGDWLDLDIAPGAKKILNCNLRSRVVQKKESRVWTAEMAIPMNALTQSFDPHDIWRINLFRIEGREPGRFYSAWRPTHTSRPNFHVPDAFGYLYFH